MRVRIKRFSPLKPYSFHDKVKNKVYDAYMSPTGMYVVAIGIMHTNHKSQTDWAFDPREVEVLEP